MYTYKVEIHYPSICTNSRLSQITKYVDRTLLDGSDIKFSDCSTRNHHAEHGLPGTIRWTKFTNIADAAQQRSTAEPFLTQHHASSEYTAIHRLVLTIPYPPTDKC